MSIEYVENGDRRGVTVWLDESEPDATPSETAEDTLRAAALRQLTRSAAIDAETAHAAIELVARYLQVEGLPLGPEAPADELLRTLRSHLALPPLPPVHFGQSQWRNAVARLRPMLRMPESLPITAIRIPDDFVGHRLIVDVHEHSLVPVEVVDAFDAEDELAKTATKPSKAERRARAVRRIREANAETLERLAEL
ncbi:hypothetical protein LN042_31830 [Kitasatospora sp. RB6PN24]|uniref:hypothetical protein n=1 Tax=Kitasatospora humi TaxID=2893891 RepID=UPI001E539F5E|nr:hypothetical protein [Kitasatospora humi]MCC9311602.1 hypothetical protein [Kitasatospora humi]